MPVHDIVEPTVYTVGRATITPQTFMQPTYSMPQPIRACGPRPPKVTAVAAAPPAAHIVALTPQTAAQLMPKRGPAATVLARRRGARENFMMSILIWHTIKTN